MKTYKITLSEDFFKLLDQAKKSAGILKNKKIAFEKVGEVKGKYSTEIEVEVKCDSDDTFFMLGFFLERHREDQQKMHYDLRDLNDITVTVPDAFLLICKFFEASPATALELFAGDLCHHPFITGGSDERSMAGEYFLRGNAPVGDDEDPEEVFWRLKALRNEWEGNDHQDEFKTLYRERIEEIRDWIERELEERKVAQ